MEEKGARTRHRAHEHVPFGPEPRERLGAADRLELELGLDVCRHRPASSNTLTCSSLTSDGTAGNAPVVVPVVGVPVSLVVADGRPALVHERASPHRRPRRTRVEIDAGEPAREPAVLDDVVDAGGTTARVRIGPFGEQADANLVADLQAPEAARAGEVLHVDARGRPVDVDPVEDGAVRRRPRPQARPSALAHAHALDHARVSDPDTRLGGAVGRARERAGDTGDGDVGQVEGPLELGAGGLVGVDEDAVVRELAHDEPGGGEALRLPHDEAAPDDLVPPQGDVEHACPLGRAPDQDLRPLRRLRRVTDVEDETAYEPAPPSVVPAEAEADPQDGSPQPTRVEAMAVRVEERPGASVDAVGEHDGGRPGSPQRLDELCRGRHAHGARRGSVRGGWYRPHEVRFRSVGAGLGLDRVLIVPARKRRGGCSEDESDDEG